MTLRAIILTFLITATVYSCKQEQSSEVKQNTSETKEFSLPEWAISANLYELNTRQFSQEGNFQAIIDELPRLKSMGVDIIWLMPVQPISMKNRKAKGDLMVEDIDDPEERKKYLGSPYAVGDYLKINPDYGDPSKFKELVKKAHAQDMYLIIDWVPNHTGWDNPWITDHPEWYTKDDDGNIIDPIDYNTGKSWGWTDVADLNFDNQEMRQAMIDAMKFWLTEYDIDGFRVDVAHGVPQDFFDSLTPALTDVKDDIFLLAESNVESHRNNKTYHATYGWEFHHLMNEIARGEKPVKEIQHWYEKDKSRYKEGFHIHFTSNHDENTWAGTVFERMGDGHKALAVLAATLEGMPLVYNGQEEPLRKRLEFFVKDPIDWKDYAYTEFYKGLFDLKDDNKALWNGKHGSDPVFEYIDDKSIVFSRAKDDNKVIVILNLSKDAHAIPFSFNDKAFSEMNGKQLLTDEEGMIKMDPWSYLIYTK
ncbi:MAG: alpha-amylase [Bacteroidia bacterium]|nr:alpha-amylase [Bacteroidia bacterium]